MVVALEERLFAVLLRIEQIEGRPEDGVEERHFNGAARHPADIGFVREEEDAGVLRANERALMAGLAENEDLRIEGNVELFEQPAEPSAGGPAADFIGLLLESLVKFSRPVVRLRRRIVDRRVFKRLGFLTARRGGDQQQAQPQEEVPAYAGRRLHADSLPHGEGEDKVSLRPPDSVSGY